MEQMNNPPKSVEIVRGDTAIRRTSNPKSTAQGEPPSSSRAVALSNNVDGIGADSYGFDFGRPKWHQHGLCRGRLDEFFAQRMPKTRKDELIAVCQQCTVRTQCLETALSFEIDEDGIFGGCSPQDRKVIRFERAQVASGQTA